MSLDPLNPSKTPGQPDGDTPTIPPPAGDGNTVKTAPVGADGKAWDVGARAGEMPVVLHGKHADYTIQGMLGEGGFGCVYKAARTATSGTGGAGSASGGSPEADAPDTVAAKTFRIRDAEVSRAALRRELNALLALRHPCIPPLLDYSFESDPPFVVMPYYSRGSLDKEREKLGEISPEWIARLLRDLLRALVAAHAVGVLHLDIKPANVLINDDDNFHLTDFGVALGVLVPWSMFQVRPLGTAGYQAPEQKNEIEAEIDTRTDLWGVGATVWSLATGKHPLSNFGPIEFDPTRSRFGFPPIRRFRPAWPPELEMLILDLVAMSPSDRPGGAAEALAQLDRILEDHDRPTPHPAAAGGGGDLNPSAGTGEHARAASDATEAEAETDTQHHDAEAGVPLPGVRADRSLVADLRDRLFDAMWCEALTAAVPTRHVRVLADGDCLAREGAREHHAFALLRGEVRIEREGKTLALERREGTFLGEVAAFTGQQRTASMFAVGETVVAAFNAAEFERFIARYPPLALRLIRELCARVERESKLNQSSDEE